MFASLLDKTGQRRGNVRRKTNPSESKSGKSNKPLEVVKEGSISVPIYASRNIIPQRDPQTGAILYETLPDGQRKALVKYQSDIQTRDAVFWFGSDAKLPRKFVAESNAFHAESRLLDILRDAGYQAEYVLNAKRYPTALHIRVPPGKSASGYSEQEEIITLTAGHRAILKATHSLPKRNRKPKKT